MCSIVLFLFGAAAVCVFILHSSARSTATEFDFRKSFAGESRQTRERPKLFSNMNLSVGERVCVMRITSVGLLTFFHVIDINRVLYG